MGPPPGGPEPQRLGPCSSQPTRALGAKHVPGPPPAAFIPGFHEADIKMTWSQDYFQNILS